MAKSAASEIETDGEPVDTAAEANRLVRRLKASAATAKGTGGAGFQIDSHFPGGNGIVESISSDVVRLRPDARDSEDGWFYWSIRVRGAGGKSLTFVFSEQDPVAVYGPAVSLDEGVTWQWMGNPDGSADSFRCALPQKALSVRLSFGINYTDLHWQRFCGRLFRHRSFIREDIMCLSRKGRAVPRLHVGRLDGKARYRMLVTARHHACETMGSYALEGFVLAALTEDDNGAWFRENVELAVVPFLDRDGVEDGDQGKNRAPRDHHRDYSEDSLYPETKALREFTRKWGEERLVFMTDLHCPWIRGNKHEQIYQVAKLDPNLWAEQRFFGEILTNCIRGVLPFKNVDDQHYGDEWRATADRTVGACAADWFAKLPGMRMATAFEIPYANCSGVRVTAEGVRAFGRDLATAAKQYLADEVEIEEEAPEKAKAQDQDDVPMAKIYVDPNDPKPAPSPRAPVAREAPRHDPPAPRVAPTPPRVAPPSTVPAAKPASAAPAPASRSLVPRGGAPGNANQPRIVIHARKPTTSQMAPVRSRS